MSIEDRANRVKKQKQMHFRRLYLKNVTIFQDDHIGIIKINMSLKQVVDRWAAFVQVRKFQKGIVVSSILPIDRFSLIFVLASKKWSNPKKILS